MTQTKTKADKKTDRNILQLLQELPDHRRKEGREYKFDTILLIIIMAIAAGAKSERRIDRFAKDNEKVLVEELQIKKGTVPRRHVFVNLIQSLDFKVLENIFYKWTKTQVDIKEKDWVSIDGKAIKGTFPKDSHGLNGFVSLITVFMSKSKQVLKSGKINTHKENEIPTVKELIKTLGLQGVIFTLDALHAQKKTVETIVKSKNDYVIGLKKNQKKLLTQVKKIVKK